MDFKVTFKELHKAFEIGFKENSQIFKIDYSNNELKFKVDYGEIQRIAINDFYKGDYEVIPKVTEQILKTADLSMSKDLKVHEIPCYEVSNESGITVSIG